MPGKRKDQRLLIERQLAEMVLANALEADLAQELEQARANLADVIDRASESLKGTDLEQYEKLAAIAAGRRGEARFEMDPDGALVLVVAYGGDQTPALVRDTFTRKAWNRRPQTAKKPAPPPKGRGFIKRSPSVSQVKVVSETSPVFHDDLSRLFESEPEPTPQPTPQEPVKRKRTLMRLGGTEKGDLSKKDNPLLKGSGAKVDLAAILKSTTDD